ncbi:MAG: HAD family hydrolase [Promethearchaeota archaeon]|nr:MAG: HAD family hydrolase [Candidatus Lokiarchaeota archaeon]
MKNDQQVIEKLKSRSFKAIIFDFDGTILDIMEPLRNSIEEVYSEKGINSEMESTIHEIGSVLESVQGYPIPKILLQSYEIFNYITSLEKLSFLKKFRVALKIFSRYQEYSKEAQLFPETKILLEFLYKNVDLYIVSHNQSKSIIEHLQKHDIEKYFKEFFGADKLPHLKPDPEALMPVLGKYRGSKIKDFLIIGDMPSDIEAGKELGIHTIAIASGISKKEILLEYDPDLLVNSISELLNLIGIENGRFSNSNIQDQNSLKIKS